MPKSLKWLPRPKLMRIKYGKGHLKALVVATYTRKVNGKTHTSHHIPALDRKRFAAPEKNVKRHHAHEQFTDLEVDGKLRNI
jgi:hypothetical protein